MSIYLGLIEYSTDQSHSARKPNNQTDRQKEHLDSDKESQCQPLRLQQICRRVSRMRNPLRGLKQLKRKRSASLQKEIDKKKQTIPSIKKRKKGMGSEVELVVSQLTTIVRVLEEHDFQNIAEVPGEDRSGEIHGVNANMVCLAETDRGIDKVPPEHKPCYEKLRRKREKNISNEAMHDSFVHTGFYKRCLLRMQRLRDQRASRAPP